MLRPYICPFRAYIYRVDASVTAGGAILHRYCRGFRPRPRSLGCSEPPGRRGRHHRWAHGGRSPPPAPPAPAPSTTAATPFRNSAPTVTIVSAATPLGNGAPTITIVSSAPTAPLGLARRRRRTVAPVARVAAITPLATIARIATIVHVAATLHRIAFPYRRRVGAPPRDEGAFRSPEPRPDATISRIGAGAVLEVHLPATAVGHATAVDEQVV